MASLEEAYSTEMHIVMNADDAHDFYWQGKIKDQHNFICPGKNCGMQVTCKCMTIPEYRLKKTPYFIIPGGHKKECSLFEEGLKVNYIEKDSSERGPNKLKGTKEKFKFNRPPEHSQPVGEIEPGREREKGTKNNYTPGNNHNQGITSLYTVKSIVSRWIKYRQNKIDNIKTLEMERDITYKKLFKSIYNQPLEKIPDENFIYYGVAYVNTLKENMGYQIKFTGSFNVDNEYKKPSTAIFNSLIEKYKIKNSQVQRIEKFARSEDKRALVFIYSKPYIKNGYINFYIDNLDLIHLESLDFFEELKTL